MTEIIPCTNEEVDRQFGGGIPFPTLMLIEGDHGTGKSALAAQFMKGFLQSGKKILCVTENTVKEYIENMKAITFNFSTAFGGQRVRTRLDRPGANPIKLGAKFFARS